MAFHLRPHTVLTGRDVGGGEDGCVRSLAPRETGAPPVLPASSSLPAAFPTTTIPVLRPDAALFDFDVTLFVPLASSSSASVA
jgi:hypothetical protein